MSKTYTGINIQFPISQDILNGKKSIETRTYPISKKYLNTEMLLIETPGKDFDFTSRITAIIKFTEIICYKCKEDFYKDTKKHLVTPDSIWAWKNKKKYGWKVEVIKKISPPIIFTNRKGIIYTTNISLKH